MQLTHHAFSGLSGALIAKKEATAVLEEVGDVIHVEAEVINKHLEDMQDGVRPRDLELCQLAVEARVF